MKKKTMALVSSCAAIALCSSIITGATYALFTDNDSVNISVTSGKVSVSAEIENVVTASNGTVKNEQLSANYNEATKLLTINEMLPGDVVTFKVNVKSEATVNVKYRLSFGSTDENNALFNELLLGVKDTAEEGEEYNCEDYDYYISNVSAWETIEYNESDKTQMVKEKYVAIELPAYVSDTSLQGATCNIAFSVEAVQANASGGKYDEEAKAVRAYRVNSDEELKTAVEADTFNSGDAVVLDVLNKKDWKVATDSAKEFILKGCDVATLTVDAPNATIHYYVNYTDKVVVDKTAENSFHVYGTVGKDLTVNLGRVVIETGAAVTKAVVAPIAGNTATIVTNADVKALVVEGAGKANVEVAEDVTVSELTVTNTNEESSFENKGNITQKVATTEELMKAVKIGGNIVLTAVGGNIVLTDDVIIEKAVVITAADGTVLDLNGHTVSANNFDLIIQGNHLTIKNGTFCPPGNEDIAQNPLAAVEGKRNSYALFVGDEIETDDTVLENLIMYGGVNVYNAHNVVLKDCEIHGTDFRPIWADQNAHIIIESGTYYTGKYGLVQASQTSGAEGRIEIRGGQFFSVNSDFNNAENSANALFYLDTENYKVEGSTVKVGDKFINGYEVTQKLSAVSAKTADEFKWALKNVREGATITLESDIYLLHTGSNLAGSPDTYLTTPNVTVDLNGHTITMLKGGQSEVFTIAADGVTLKNGKLNFLFTSYSYALWVTAGAKNVRIENVEIVGGMQVIGNSSVTLANVNIKASTKYYCVYLEYFMPIPGGTVTVTIESGTFTANGNKAVFYTGTNNAQVIINGGETIGTTLHSGNGTCEDRRPNN